EQISLIDHGEVRCKSPALPHPGTFVHAPDRPLQCDLFEPSGTTNASLGPDWCNSRLPGSRRGRHVVSSLLAVERPMRRFAVLLVVMLAAACGSDSSSAPVVPNVVGTWALETMDSKVLPVVLQQAGEDKIELMASGLTAV